MARTRNRTPKQEAGGKDSVKKEDEGSTLFYPATNNKYLRKSSIGDFMYKQATDMLTSPTNNWEPKIFIDLVGASFMKESLPLVCALNSTRKSLMEISKYKGSEFDSTKTWTNSVIKGIKNACDAFHAIQGIEKVPARVQHNKDASEALNVNRFLKIKAQTLVCKNYVDVLVECKSNIENGEEKRMHIFLQEALEKNIELSTKLLNEADVQVEKMKQKLRSSKSARLDIDQKISVHIKRQTNSEHKVCNLSACLDVLQSSGDKQSEMAVLLNLRQRASEDEGKQRKGLEIAQKLNVFSQECNRLLRVVNSLVKSESSKSAEAAAQHRKNVLEQSTVMLKNEVHSLGDIIIDFLKFQGERQQHAKCKIDQKKTELDQHLRLYGNDEAPSELKEINSRIKEYQEVLTRTKTLTDRVAKQQLDLWKPILETKFFDGFIFNSDLLQVLLETSERVIESEASLPFRSGALNGVFQKLIQKVDNRSISNDQENQNHQNNVLGQKSKRKYEGNIEEMYDTISDLATLDNARDRFSTELLEHRLKRRRQNSSLGIRDETALQKFLDKEFNGASKMKSHVSNVQNIDTRNSNAIVMYRKSLESDQTREFPALENAETQESKKSKCTIS